MTDNGEVREELGRTVRLLELVNAYVELTNLYLDLKEFSPERAFVRGRLRDLQWEIMSWSERAGLSGKDEG